jgi:hypothetical protein
VRDAEGVLRLVSMNYNKDLYAILGIECESIEETVRQPAILGPWSLCGPFCQSGSG